MQCGVFAPPDTLVGRQFAGALAFEKEYAFLEGVMVILATGDGGAMDEEGGGNEEENGGKSCC